MDTTSVAGMGGIAPAMPQRVFLSHTSDLGKPDESGSFVAAASGRRPSGPPGVVVYFAARETSPAAYCGAPCAECGRSFPLAVTYHSRALVPWPMGPRSPGHRPLAVSGRAMEPGTVGRRNRHEARRRRGPDSGSGSPRPVGPGRSRDGRWSTGSTVRGAAHRTYDQRLRLERILSVRARRHRLRLTGGPDHHRGGPGHQVS